MIWLAGLAYLVIGRVFAVPGDHARAWRLAAWIVSGGVFAAHIAWERLRRGFSPRTTASRAALGVVIGAFALAVAGMMRSLSATGAIRPTWLLALVAWPLLIAIPAFLVAWGAASIAGSRS